MGKKFTYTEPLRCRHCGSLAPMRVVGSVTDLETDEDKAGGPPWERGTIYEITSCANCDEVMMRAGFWHDGMENPSEWNATVLYPPERRKLVGLPAKVHQEYEAAQKVAAIAPNAYAVLLGRVLDCVCSDRNAVGKSLSEKLNDLAVKQEIPAHLAEMAHKLRQLRNVGAHADLGSLSNSEIPVLEALCRAVLEYVYEAPRLLKEVQARIDAIKGSSGKAPAPGSP